MKKKRAMTEIPPEKWGECTELFFHGGKKEGLGII